MRHEPGNSLLNDTLADKAVRFGCGGVLAGLIAVGSVMSGLVEAVSVFAVVSVVVLFVVTAGFLSAAFGERFIHALLKLIKWLA